jgi:hypothetical protein
MKSKKNRKFLTITAMALMAITGFTSTHDLSAQTLKERKKATAIAKKMLDRDDGRSQYSDILLMSCYYKEKGGSKKCSSSPRKKSFESITKDTGRNGKDTTGLSIIKSPSSEKNVAFLQKDYDREGKETDQWIYFPALKKLKRIVSESSNSPKTGSFFGSEISYEDLEKIHLSDYRYSYEGPAKIDGRKAHLIVSYPSPRRARKTSYGKSLIWIDTVTYIPLKMDLYNRQGRLSKSIYMKSIIKSKGVWIARQMIVVNYTNRRMSLMKTKHFAVNIAIPGDLFTSRALKDSSFREMKMNAVRRSAR